MLSILRDGFLCVVITILFFTVEVFALDAVDIAINQIGKPYFWGGNGPAVFDCSGLTKYVYEQIGIDLPRTSLEQSQIGDLVVGMLQRGDLLFFMTDDTRPGVVTHVGIYEANNIMIDANSYDSEVTRDDITSSYWSPRFLFAQRVHHSPTFDAAVNLSANPGSSDFSDIVTQIAVSGASVYVVWQDSTNNQQILFRRSTDNGVTWDTPQAIGISPSAHRPVIAASGANVFVVWNATGNDGANHLFLRRSGNNGGTFEAIQDLGRAPSPGSFFQIDVASVNVYVAWRDVPCAFFCLPELKFRRSPDAGVTWDPPLNQAARNLSGIGVSVLQAGVSLAISGPNVYVTWEAFDLNSRRDGLFFRRSGNNGGTFEAIQQVGTGFSPYTAVSGQTVYLFWLEDQPTGHALNTDVLFRKSTDGGITWNPPLDQPGVNISNTPGVSWNPLATASSGTLYIVWGDSATEPNQDPFNLLVRRSIDDGVTWDPPLNQPAVSLSARIAGYEPHQVAVSGTHISVAWDDYNPTRRTPLSAHEILFRHSADCGLTWDPPLGEPALNLSANVGMSLRPRMAVNGPNIYVAWIDDTLGNFDIFFRRGMASQTSSVCSSFTITVNDE